MKAQGVRFFRTFPSSLEAKANPHCLPGVLGEGRRQVVREGEVQREKETDKEKERERGWGIGHVSSLHPVTLWRALGPPLGGVRLEH